MKQFWARKNGATSLVVLRINLASVVMERLTYEELWRFDRRARGLNSISLSYIDSSTKSPDSFVIAEEAATALSAAELAASTSGEDTFTAYFAAGYAVNWSEISADVDLLNEGRNPTSFPLWHGRSPDWFLRTNAETRAIWAADPPGRWDFWIRWWDGILAGKPLDWDLQRDVALIPDADWQQGPDHIARLIAGIEALHHSVKAGDPISADLVALPAAPLSTVERVKSAISLNRDSLPPTFDAIEGFIQLEVARLQSLNYRTDDQAEECRRQIAVLGILHDAIRRMRLEVPESGDVTTAQAETVERLTRVFGRHLKEWPRANAGELVDSAYRAALVGSTTALLPLLGVAPTYALGAGIVLFGGKKIGEAMKVAKDVISPKG